MAGNSRSKKALPTPESKQFCDAEKLAEDLLEILRKQERQGVMYDESGTCLCRDGKRRIVAIMTYALQREALLVNHLLTNPINIRSVANGTEEHRVAGAGSLLLEAAMKVARLKGKIRVDLDFYREARGFYLRNGFIEKRGVMVKNVDI